MNKDLENVVIEGGFLVTTMSKYKLFMSYGKTGMDAFLLYNHLMFTAQLQKTNSVWANNKYIRQGLEWGTDRLRKAKNLLFDLGIIEQKQGKKENGDFDKSYIVVKTSTSILEFNENDGALDSGTRQPRSPVSGTKCFNKEVKCLNKEENTLDLQAFDKWWLLYDYKVGKSKAKKAFLKLDSSLYPYIFKHTKEYVKSQPDKKYRKHPITYLNNECWTDEVINKNNGPQYEKLKRADYK
jgi:hypothetical protein